MNSSQSTAASNSDSLSRIAAILATIASGISLFSLLAGFISFGAYVPSIRFILATALALIGAILYFSKKSAPLPWLLLASVLLEASEWAQAGLQYAIPGFVIVSDFLYLLSYFSLSNLSWLLGGVPYLLIFIGFVLALVSFIQQRSSGTKVSDASSALQPVVENTRYDASGTALAGWFADPNGLPAERYWDGQAWTDQTRPPSAPSVTGNYSANQRLVVDAYGNPVSPSSRLIALLLCLFLGGLGIHRFYVGKIGTGVAMIFTLGGLGIWSLIDLIMIAVGSFKDKQNRPLLNWQ